MFQILSKMLDAGPVPSVSLPNCILLPSSLEVIAIPNLFITLMNMFMPFLYMYVYYVLFWCCPMCFWNLFHSFLFLPFTFFFFFFFFLWLHPWHVKVPRPGLEAAPQQWQPWIFNPPSHQGTPSVYIFNVMLFRFTCSSISRSENKTLATSILYPPPSTTFFICLPKSRVCSFPLFILSWTHSNEPFLHHSV